MTSKFNKVYYLSLAGIVLIFVVMMYLHFNGGYYGLNITWPPGYYTLRDRVPFFLTIIYVYRHYLPPGQLNLFAGFLVSITVIITIGATTLYLLGSSDMTPIAGFHWSPPSPIEWGVFILASIQLLRSRGTEFYESIYMSLITALSGGWLYEAHLRLVPLNLAKLFMINASKVFLVDFQLLCLPIILYIIYIGKKYRVHWLLAPITIISIILYAATPWLRVFLPPYIGHDGYRWVVRLPTIAVLYTLLYGVKGDKI